MANNIDLQALDAWKPDLEFGSWFISDYPYTAFIEPDSKNRYNWLIQGESFRGSYFEPPEYSDVAEGNAPTLLQAASEANAKLEELISSLEEEYIW